MEKGEGWRPHARAAGLLSRDLPDGLMVYDLDRHWAHSLNRTAALVWTHCDGKTDISDLAKLLQQELGLPADEVVVWLTLARLEKAHLLQKRLACPGEATQITRRAVVQKLGLAGGLLALLPLVDGWRRERWNGRNSNILWLGTQVSWYEISPTKC